VEKSPSSHFHVIRMPHCYSTIKGTFVYFTASNRRRPRSSLRLSMKMEDKMAKLFSCNTSAINVKSEDIGTVKATTTSTRKRPCVTTPSVIVIEDDDKDDQRSSLSSYTLGNKQELQLIVEGTAVSIYNKNKTKKYMSLTAIQWVKLTSCWKNIDEKLKSYICNRHGIFQKRYNLIQLPVIQAIPVTPIST